MVLTWRWRVAAFPQELPGPIFCDWQAQKETCSEAGCPASLLCVTPPQAR